MPYLQRKKERLETNHSEVFASLPRTQIEQREVLNLLLDYLPHQFPESYDRASDHITIKATHQT